jgi:hypothetical protein
MAVNLATATSLRVVKPQASEPAVFPAPLKGMDARVPLAIDSMDSCLWAINMVPTEYAMRVRLGYREWQIGIGAEARTTISFFGSGSSGSADKVFIATTDGIYDCTTSGAAPVLKVAFAVQSADAGYGVYMSSVDESGDDFMFYADAENGLFRYDPATETWALATGIQEKAGSIGVVDITNIVFVVEHKLRIWFFEKDANKAWYLPIRSATGDATEFFFGSKFKHGGELAGLYNWTIDGGLGRDDNLVAISRGGDVIPWTGEDPADSSTWSTTGMFYVGPVPLGNRVASEYGGELFILSKFGISSMSGLMRGAEMADPNANQIGHKISRLLRQDLDVYGENRGWAIKFVASIGSLLVTVPLRQDGRYRQYSYNIATGGWGLWRDVPMLSSDSWKGALMVGTADGKVHRMDVNRDNVTLAGATGDPITWFLLTSYSHLGAPATFKRTQLVRPNFVAQSEPLYEITAHYDYQTDEPGQAAGSPAAGAGSLWDTGLWGDALWGVDLATPWNQLLGATGIGRSMAIALVGSSTSQTDLASIDVLWDKGGLL